MTSRPTGGSTRISLGCCAALSAVLAALALGVPGASGSSPGFGCRIQVVSNGAYSIDLGSHVTVVDVAGCRVAIEAIRLTFPRPVRGDAYDVLEPDFVMIPPAQPRGSGTRTLTLVLPQPLTATHSGAACPNGDVRENVAPRLPVGSRVTVTLISTQGVDVTSVVPAIPHQHFCIETA